jgi:dienelactone hydrolase
MKLIVISDIFGWTSALNTFINQFYDHYEMICVIDPYSGRNLHFLNEEDAYQHFQHHCGLEQLTDQLRIKLGETKGFVDIIGFSVGAAAAWEISGECRYRQIRKVIGFYGSRIREKTEICPDISTSLIFPKYEKNFDLEPVIQTLEKKNKVEIIRTEYLHGFMNKKSVNYSEEAYKYFSKWLQDKIGCLLNQKVEF